MDEIESFLKPLRALRQEELMLRLWQSGRELFHSNVLAYLIESPRFGDQLLQYLWGERCHNYHVRALREYNGIDLLVIMLPNAPEALEPDSKAYWSWLASNVDDRERPRILAIENKFKSLPDAAQLQHYSEKLHQYTATFARPPGWYRDLFHDGDDPGEKQDRETRQPYLSAQVRKVILTPTPMEGMAVRIPITYEVAHGMKQRRKLKTGPDEKTDTWTSKNWQDIANLMVTERCGCARSSDRSEPSSESSHRCVRDAEDGYIAQAGHASGRYGLEELFVMSYGSVVQAGTRLQSLVRERSAGPKGFAGLDALRSHIKPLGLTDFVEKWRYAFLTQMVQDCLARTSWERMQIKVQTSRGYEWQFRRSSPHAPDVVAIVGTFFSRGTGGTDIGLFAVGRSQVGMAIQLQGNTLKLMFAHAGKESEKRQRRATCASLRMLLLRGEHLRRAFGTTDLQVDQLGCYTQEVGVFVRRESHDAGSLLALEKARGRLLYAKTQVWNNDKTDSGSPTVGVWGDLSAQAIATELVKLVHEVTHHWAAINHSIRSALNDERGAVDA
jgi:hypothetical protein